MVLQLPAHMLTSSRRLTPFLLPTPSLHRSTHTHQPHATRAKGCCCNTPRPEARPVQTPRPTPPHALPLPLSPAPGSGVPSLLLPLPLPAPTARLGLPSLNWLRMVCHFCGTRTLPSWSMKCGAAGSASGSCPFFSASIRASLAHPAPCGIREGAEAGRSVKVCQVGCGRRRGNCEGVGLVRLKPWCSGSVRAWDRTEGSVRAWDRTEVAAGCNVRDGAAALACRSACLHACFMTGIVSRLHCGAAAQGRLMSYRQTCMARKHRQGTRIVGCTCMAPALRGPPAVSTASFICPVRHVQRQGSQGHALRSGRHPRTRAHQTCCCYHIFKHSERRRTGSRDALWAPPKGTHTHQRALAGVRHGVEVH